MNAQVISESLGLEVFGVRVIGAEGEKACASICQKPDGLTIHAGGQGEMSVTTALDNNAALASCEPHIWTSFADDAIAILRKFDP